MPSLSVWAIRTAMMYLLAGFTFGGLLLANEGLAFFPYLWRLLPAHIEFLLLGWTAQLGLGVAYWILPRFPGGSRGRAWPVWVAMILLNVGVLLVAAQGTFAWPPQFWTAGRSLELLAVLFFVAHAWNRIRPTRLRQLSRKKESRKHPFWG